MEVTRSSLAQNRSFYRDQSSACIYCKTKRVFEFMISVLYQSLRSGFVLKIDSWLRIQDVHSFYLFGKDNCRLASFLKQLENLLQIERVQICDSSSIDELTSLFFTNNTVILLQGALRSEHLSIQDPDQHSISKVDNFWQHTCCVDFHCAWLVMLEALASHAVVTDTLITTSLHKCWIKYLTDLLLEIKNILDPDQTNHV